MDNYIKRFSFFFFLILLTLGNFNSVFSENGEPEPIEEIWLKAQFIDTKNMTMQIYLTNFSFHNTTIVDYNGEVIFNSLENPSNYSAIYTDVLLIERGKPYFLIVEDLQGKNLTNVFYCTENILESIPISYWLGLEYQDYYNEYLDVFERAYNVILNLTRDGKEIETGGVTINRVSRSVAYGGYGAFTYGIAQWFEFPFIEERVYLPGNTANYTHPDYGTMTMSAGFALSTRFHELAHAVLLETSGNDPFPQEGLACFFEIELFRLLGYNTEYIRDRATVATYNFQNYVGTNHTLIATQFMNAHEHVFPGAWIAAYLLEDFVGYGEYESEIWGGVPVLLVPDYGWTFLSHYFMYSTIFDAPTGYNLNERLLFFFEVASGTSLREHFTSWGFNITDNYRKATYLKYCEKISVESKNYSIPMFANSTISNFNFNQSLRTISFTTDETNGTDNLCEIAIPDDLIWGDFSVYLDDSPLIEGVEYTSTNNGDYTIFSVTYIDGSHLIEIVGTEAIPEIPTFIISSILFALLLTIQGKRLIRKLESKITSY